MCGISGFVATGDTTGARELLEAMNERLRHRGPDDGGVWLCGSGGVRVGLAARRLSIIDLSERGHMPMSSADGRLHITYNGEVYNFREVRRELEARGRAFRSDTDTEVVLNAYAEWGPECLHRLNGMFAFAVWDERERELFVARDRLGVKPLHYAAREGGFAFASEMKALFEDASLPREIDWDALDLYLTFRVIPHPYTIFKSVRKLAPGHYLVWKDGRVAERAYWDVFGRANGKSNGEGSSVEDLNGHGRNGHARRNGNGGVAAIKRELFELVEDAVRVRLVSDVPLGVMLSGRVDSRVVPR